jgi:hypothetical protein
VKACGTAHSPSSASSGRRTCAVIRSYETVDWSQARYDDYGFIAVDVAPAAKGQRTTMTRRFINEHGGELDRVVFSRTAREILRLP